MPPARRGSTGLCGIIALDKPSGPTSHDMVGLIRRACGEGRVGHCGTLDPMASGLLIICVGPATRLADHLMAQTKSYTATIVFGSQTSTDDSTGKVVCTADVPPAILDRECACRALAARLGPQQQVPPAFSAIKRAGQPAYRAARRGDAVELQPRSIEVYSADLLSMTHNTWEVAFTVSKGTYIRALARDIGHDLCTRAHLGALRRTASGHLHIEQAHPVTADAQPADLPRPISSWFTDPAAALGLPVLNVNAAQEQAVRNGRPLSVPPGTAPAYSIVCGHRLLALYSRAGTGDSLKPQVVIPGGIDGVQ